MKIIGIACGISFSALYVPALIASVLPVPENYATVQAALNASLSGDTVLVAPGVYHEFLIGPEHSLTLSGWHSGDTLPDFRTILDPIPSAGDTPSVAVFECDSLTIRNFTFFNRIELRQYEFATRTGGVEFSGGTLALISCRFDSVSRAVNGGTRVYAENCTFNHCIAQCIRPSTNGSLIATHCTFDGDSGNWLVRCYSGSSIRSCDFLCSASQTDLLSVSGSNIEIIGCRFGPCYSAFPIVRVATQGECRIEDCIFEGIERSSSLVEVSMECPGPEGVPIRIRGNTFSNYSGIPPAQGTAAVKLICQSDHFGDFGVIQDNVFVDGFGQQSAGVFIVGSVEIENNNFEDLGPGTSSDIYVMQLASDTVIARNNRFLEPGIAASTEGSYFDARENWWGDSTGPYNPNFNPEGMGTEVGDDVVFEPWLIHDPDSTVDTSEVVVEREQNELPGEFSIQIYPNPFNNDFQIEIAGFTNKDFAVMLYDLLGREVAMLFQGPMTSPVLHVTAPPQLASGVYFLKAADRMQTVTRKVVLLK